MVKRAFRALRGLGRTGCLLGLAALAVVVFWRWGGRFPEASETVSPTASPVPAASSELPEDLLSPLSWADDGIAPFHEETLPGISVTPEPDRDWGEVVETVISGGEEVEGCTVRDTTGSDTDLAWELSQTPAAKIRGDGSVEVLIYHTHTSEAYSPTYTGFYYTDMEVRTQNREMSVVAAGEELKKVLESYGIGVIHDTTVNDTAFNGSYSRSWEVIQNNLEAYPGIQVTIDLHRDSMTTETGTKYKPTVPINGRKAAQFMLLAGCNWDDSWDDFPDWEQNLRLMLRVQQTAERLFPGLARPLDFSDSRYNMNATPGSMLVEVGTEVNTVSEAKYGARLFGEALAETLLSLR